jgi:hypothetical protein
VRQRIEPSLRNYFNSVAEIIEPQTLAPEHASEFQRVRTRLLTMDYATVDSIMGIFGDPKYCIDRIAELKERFGFSRLVSWFEVGGLTGHREVIDSMRLFANQVMPRLR